MNNMTKLFFTLGAATGGYQFLEELDLIFGILLKGISIVSFLIVIIINWPKLKERVKEIIASIKSSGK